MAHPSTIVELPKVMKFNLADGSLLVLEPCHSYSGGGEGVVYKAFHHADRSEWAVKHVKTSSNPDIYQDMHREMDRIDPYLLTSQIPAAVRLRASKFLAAPCVVCRTSPLGANYFTVVSPWVGPNLHQVLRGLCRKDPHVLATKKQRTDVSLNLAYCLGRALEPLHEYKIACRDIKFSNVGGDPSQHGTLALFDLGLAALAEEVDTRPGDAGTRSWKAPEVEREKKFCLKSDMFSAGLMVGRIAMRSTSWSDRTELMHQKQDFIDDKVKELVLGLTDPSIASRWSSKKLVQTLERWSRDGTISLQPESTLKFLLGEIPFQGLIESGGVGDIAFQFPDIPSVGGDNQPTTSSYPDAENVPALNPQPQPPVPYAALRQRMMNQRSVDALQRGTEEVAQIGPHGAGQAEPAAGEHPAWFTDHHALLAKLQELDEYKRLVAKWTPQKLQIFEGILENFVGQQRERIRAAREGGVVENITRRDFCPDACGMVRSSTPKRHTIHSASTCFSPLQRAATVMQVIEKARKNNLCFLNE
eukprot:TRINITY_DN9828_c0_g1_i1.p1 TRINITY_DN9828_c0_g1~~TRINITY_DN9828_c0_g1_i1.p1  ORF type:complete len:530 (+),score=81.70 TRINITY_DN9828_c0_g1_i1:38-1627(+)